MDSPPAGGAGPGSDPALFSHTPTIKVFLFLKPEGAGYQLRTRFEVAIDNVDAELDVEQAVEHT